MMSRKRWLLLYAAAIAAAVVAGFNDHGLIPGLPSSIIGSILNQLVKTVGLLGVGDMVLYFREREAHDRTKQELADLRVAQQQRDAEQQERAAEQRQRDAEERAEQRQRDAEERAAQRQRDAEHLELMQQQAEATRVMMERMQRMEEEMRRLRSEHRNGSGNPDGNSGDALS